MVAIRKPGKLRICIDPKDLNKTLKRNHYLMPTIEDILPSLAKAKVFSVLDAKDGFNQIRLDQQSSFLTTFWTPFGRYRWLRVPFRLKTAQEEYQKRQREVLEGLEGIQVIADDILVCGFGDTVEQANKNHDEHLRSLLRRCRELNLKLNKKKAKLRLTEVKYVGHVLTAEGVKPDPEKISTVVDMPRPVNVKEIQHFTGFINYLLKFMPHLSDICEPLRRLTKKDVEWCWESQQEKAFQECKRLATIQPILKYFDAKLPVTIQCDASDKGLGATLMQEGQPVCFAARALTETEQRYAVIEKECLAICFACDKFHQYIMCKEKVQVETDHKPLETIFKKPILAAPKRLQRMLLKVQKYQLQVQHKTGSSMFIADMLSRIKMSPQCRKETTHYDVFYSGLEKMKFTDYMGFSDKTLAQLQKESDRDSSLQELKTIVLTGWPESQTEVPDQSKPYWNFRDEIGIQNGILFKGMRVIIPSSMRQLMLQRIHSSHLGTEACIRKAKDRLFWPNMGSDIRTFVEKCTTCAAMGDTRQKEPLQTPSLPIRPWSKLAIDQFTVNGSSYLITVDYYSDYFEIDKLPSTTTRDIIKALKPHFSRFSSPDYITTDNAPNLVSNEFSQFAQEWDIQHVTSSPYHSQGNGKAESAVKIAKRMIKKIDETKSDIHLALLDWRNTPTVGMDSSPVQRLMARRTRTLIPTAGKLLQPQVCQDVTEKLIKKRQQTKRKYDKHTKPLPPLCLGQPVYIKPQPKVKGQHWEPGYCKEVLSDRSYVVSANGNQYRRNRIDLKPRNTSPQRLNEDISTQVHEDDHNSFTENINQNSPEKINRVSPEESPVPEYEKPPSVRSRTRIKKQRHPYIHIP